jgi:hypothetical protein
MPSNLRLQGNLAERVKANQQALAVARTPAEKLSASLAFLRSLTAIASKFGPAAEAQAETITSRAAQAMAMCGDDLAAELGLALAAPATDMTAATIQGVPA